HVGDGESAFLENKGVGVSKFLLYFRPPFPPPADDIDDVAIFREQAGIRLGVMLVPRLLLPPLQPSDLGLVWIFVLAQGSCRQGRRHAESYFLGRSEEHTSE